MRMIHFFSSLFLWCGKGIIMKRVVIIGAGIVGAFLAYDLAHYEDVEVYIIDQHQDVCMETSKANSAIIHAGYDPKDNTLKALLNKRGADLYPSILEHLHCDCLRCGAFVVAKNDEEVQVLQQLYKQGVNRHVDVSLVDYEELHRIEPNLQDTIIKGLWVPETSVITPWKVCEALIEEAILNGAHLCLGENVCAIKQEDETYIVQTSKNKYSCDIVINAAGLGSEHVMHMIEDETLFTITPKRGQYFVLSKQAHDYVSHIIYPAPSRAGKGVLAIPTIDGNVLLGPTSEILEETDVKNTKEGLNDVRNKLAMTMKDVPYQYIIHTYSGCRPLGNDNDFYIDESKKHKGVIHLGCIDSPGLASAPAISEYVISNFLTKKGINQKKSTWVNRKAPIVLHHLQSIDKQRLVKEKKAYGHMVCYCEQISEQEVIDCIHKPCGARSIQGVKMRVRPGMGRCQGGYCEVEIAKILARELQIPLQEVAYNETTYYTLAKEDEE